MEKTKETSEKEKSHKWWWNLKMRDRWALFFKYNPLIADAPSTISLDLKTVDPDHIKSIWKKEVLNKIDYQISDTEFILKLNKKQFVEFNEDLFKAYIAKFSKEDKLKAFKIHYNTCLDSGLLSEIKEITENIHNSL